MKKKVHHRSSMRKFIKQTRRRREFSIFQFSHVIQFHALKSLNDEKNSFFMDSQLIFSRLSQSRLNSPQNLNFLPISFPKLLNYVELKFTSSLRERKSCHTTHLFNKLKWIHQTNRSTSLQLVSHKTSSFRTREELESEINLPVVTCECAKW